MAGYPSAYKGASGWIKNMLEASNKKSLFSFFASWEFGKMLVDGNLG